MENIYLNTYLVIYEGNIENIEREFDSFIEISKNTYLIRSSKSSNYVGSKLLVDIEDYNSRLVVIKLGDEGTLLDFDDAFTKWINTALGDHWHIYNNPNTKETVFRIYLITYSSVRGTIVDSIIRKNYMSMHLFGSTWLIKTDKTSGLIGKKLTPFMRKNEKFAVVELGKDHCVNIDDY